MTYFELEQENKKLRSLLQQAVKYMEEDEGYDDFDMGGKWLPEAQLLLNPPKVDVKFATTGARWEGEECGSQDCGHSSTFHAGGGKGLCTKVDCTCHKFIPTGRETQQAR